MGPGSSQQQAYPWKGVEHQESGSLSKVESFWPALSEAVCQGKEIGGWLKPEPVQLQWVRTRLLGHTSPSVWGKGSANCSPTGLGPDRPRVGRAQVVKRLGLGRGLLKKCHFGEGVGLVEKDSFGV